MTADEFVKQELQATGKMSYTVEQVIRMVERYIEVKQAAAAAAPLQADPEIDALLGIVPAKEQRHAE